MVYDKEPKPSYYDTDWSLYLDSNSNNYPSQEIASDTRTTERVKKYQLGIFHTGKLNIFLTLIPILILFLHILRTGDHEAGAIYYCIGCRISKANWIFFLDLFYFHSLWPTFQWYSHAPLTLLQEVHNLYRSLLRFMSDFLDILHLKSQASWWPILEAFLLIYRIIPHQNHYIGFEIPFNIDLFPTLVTSCN